MFELVSKYQPQGDQPEAIEQLVAGVESGKQYQVLLGVTGSGKTFTIANTIARLGKATLVLSHNKTLAAQLYGELKQFFPNNAVEYFISYYDYYQPEAYIPGRDIFIEKDSSINDQIDRLRLKATMSLMERKDTIVVASVSCIYGLGVPEDYRKALVRIEVGEEIERNDFLAKLVNAHYGRNDIAFQRGNFRVKGDTVDVFPAYLDTCVRVEFFGDEITAIKKLNPIDNKIISNHDAYAIYPANHFVMSEERLKRATVSIREELEVQHEFFLANERYVEAQRIKQRTEFDLEMIQELGHCSGIENYSRHMTGAMPGQAPFCLLDYFPDDYLLVIDESHATIPQTKAMYAGDFSRKKNLVEYGFRLPSAYDNRPLKFEEFEKHHKNVIFMSATPADYELDKTYGEVVEQVIRPTGLVDPYIMIRPVGSQVDDLLNEIRIHTKKNQRVLVTTLTKKMTEDLSTYLKNAGIKSDYLHSSLDSIERTKVIRKLRLGEIDVLVGVNLLREGIDMPEVALVAVLDADKVGFLRSARALIQTSGRAARNVDGKVIFYADNITAAIKSTVDETNRRREKQLEFNERNNITPTTIYKSIEEIMESTAVAEGYEGYSSKGKKGKNAKPSKEDFMEYLDLDSKEKIINLLKKEMKEAASELDFEKAANLRDRIIELESI
ncbi:excinuclease ABC subunit UvrB [bacterium]|nr:excinuclease ABC subunit UvrB [bacterium]